MHQALISNSIWHRFIINSCVRAGSKTVAPRIFPEQLLLHQVNAWNVAGYAASETASQQDEAAAAASEAASQQDEADTLALMDAVR